MDPDACNNCKCADYFDTPDLYEYASYLYQLLTSVELGIYSSTKICMPDYVFLLEMKCEFDRLKYLDFQKQKQEG